MKIFKKFVFLSYKFSAYIGDLLMSKKKRVIYRGQEFLFSTVNPLTFYRAKTFATKEPATLAWIDSFDTGAVFWDVGANVGIYSVYAAKARNCRVFSFEPSVFNLELLCRNISYNKLTSYISVIPLPLFERSGLETLRLSSTTWGGAHSSFSADLDQRGQKLKTVFEYQTAGICSLDAIKCFGLAQPKYIKIDVDGLEHFVLRGLVPVLDSVNSVLVEINESFVEQKNLCEEVLGSCGFALVSKSKVGSEMYNQIWSK